MEFEFLIGNRHITMELDFVIFLVLALGFYLWMIGMLLWQGVRSLQGKPLNLPPSRVFWAKVKAEVLFSHMEEVWHSEPEAFQAAHKRLSGKPIINDAGHMRTVQRCKVQYEYGGQSYTGEVSDIFVRNGKTFIYCKKRRPTIIKAYKPQHPWSKAAGVSAVFLAGFLLLMGTVAIFGVLSP